jgi:class 3 adenylate cyclase
MRVADRVETLYVSFADLVGFTVAAHDHPPARVVDFLDGLVCNFGLTDALGVDKIKTIGDGYMAAAGFDGNAVEGAGAISRLALMMLETIDRSIERQRRGAGRGGIPTSKGNSTVPACARHSSLGTAIVCPSVFRQLPDPS